MKRQVLGGGTIVCSAVVMYGWVQPDVSGSRSAECNDRSSKAVTSDTSTQRAQVEASCSQPTTKVMGLEIPEQFLKIQWGNRSLNELGDNVETIYESLLTQSQTLASRNQYMKAIASIAGIPKNSRHYDMAQQLQEDWSKELLRQATGECQQARVAKAIAMLGAIPPTSRLQGRVSELRHNWKRQAVLLNRAIAAKKNGDWQGAIDAIQSLEGAPMYHSLLVQGLLQQSMTNLYEPDEILLQTATEDLPTVQLPVTPAEETPSSNM